MKTRYVIGTGVTALVLASTAAAHGFDPKSGKTVDQQIAEKCVGTPAQRAACARQIRESYDNYQRRATPAKR